MFSLRQLYPPPPAKLLYHMRGLLDGKQQETVTVSFQCNTSKMSLHFFNNYNFHNSIIVAFYVIFHNYGKVIVRCHNNHENILHRNLVSTYGYFHRQKGKTKTKPLQIFTLFLYLEKENKG